MAQEMALLMTEEIPPAPVAGKKRVFIVDDHPLAREWLATLINQQSDLTVSGQAGSASEAIKLIATAKPHVAIVDISMGGGSGIDLIKELSPVLPDLQIIVLSMRDEVIYCENALRAGARGYIMKWEAARNMLKAIHCVLEGKLYLSEKIAMMMAEKFVESKSPASASQVAATASQVELLSARELEVFQLLGRGFTTRQMAAELRVNFRTIQSFCARIKKKLKLMSGTELLREAMRWHDAGQER
jgi:DNA-binding NarL/FixJ family response regulator